MPQLVNLQRSRRECESKSRILDFEGLEARNMLAGDPWMLISNEITSQDGELLQLDQTLLNSLGNLTAPLPIAGESISELVESETFLQVPTQAFDQVFQSFIGQAVTEELVKKEIYSSIEQLMILVDINGSGSVTEDDILVEFEYDEGGEVTDVSVQMDLEWKLDVESIEFSMGLPGFPLSVESTPLFANGSLGYHALHFGVMDGQAFIETSGTDEELIVKLGFSLSERDNDWQIVTDANGPILGQLSGRLGFLSVNASDHINSDQSANEQGTQFVGELKIDVQGSVTDGVSQGISIGTPTLTATSQVDVAIDAFLSANPSSNPGNENLFPGLFSNLVVNWNFTSETDLDALSEDFGDEFSVRFEDVSVRLGTVVTNIISPVVETIQTLTAPVAPLIQALDEPIPLVSDLTDWIELTTDGLSILDLADALDQTNTLPPYIDALLTLATTLARVTNVVNDLELEDSNAMLSVGSFVVGSEIGDLRNLTSGDVFDSPEIENWSRLSVFASQLSTNLKDQIAEVLGDYPLVNDVLDAFFPPESEVFYDYSFPIFDDPENSAFQLLLGRDADLVRFDTVGDVLFSPTVVGSNIDIGIVEAAFVPGDLVLDSEFRSGYDTFGFRQWINDPDNPNLLLDGFYIDRDSHISVSTLMSIRAATDFVVFSGSVNGELSANLGVSVDYNPDVAGADNDAQKLRFRSSDRSEFNSCLVNMTGRLHAGLGIDVRIGVELPIVGFVGTSFDYSVGGDIIDFNESVLGCVDPWNPQLPVELAEMDSNGTLILNIGDRANHRGYEQAVEDEQYVISGVDLTLDDGTIVRQIEIAAFGLVQTFARPSRIYGEGGTGNDKIIVRSSVGDLDVEIYGNNRGDTAGSVTVGVDDELVYQGSGQAILIGGPGNDFLIGGSGTNYLGTDATLRNDWESGSDTIEGGFADSSVNFIHGGLGDDFISGQGGHSVIYGGFGRDTITAGPNGDTIYGDNGTNAMGEFGRDRITTGAGPDIVFGESGNDEINWVFPDEYSENVHNDLIDGGFGDDTINVRGSRFPDSILLAQDPEQQNLAPSIAFFNSDFSTQTIFETTNFEFVSIDGAGQADLITVNQLYGTAIRSVTINSGDRFSGDDIGDITIVSGFNVPLGHEEVTVGNIEVGLVEECSEVVNHFYNDELDELDKKQIIQCREFIDGLTEIRFDLEIELDTDENFEDFYHVFVSNQTIINDGLSDAPNDHLHLNTGFGDDTVTFHSITGNTSLFAGPGADAITARLLPSKFTPVFYDEINNAYFGELFIDAGSGANNLHFDASRYMVNPNSSSVKPIGTLLLSEDRIWGNNHIDKGIQFFATEGDYDFVFFTANAIEGTNVAIQGTRTESITWINTNNDVLNFSSSANENGTNRGHLQSINGLVYINAAPIENDNGYVAGKSNIRFSDVAATTGNQDVQILKTTADETVITGFAGNLDGALIWYRNDNSIESILLEGSDESSLDESYTYHDSVGDSFGIFANAGDDRFHILQTSIPLLLRTGVGTDRVTVGALANMGLGLIAAPVYIAGDVNSKDLVIMDDRSSQFGSYFDLTSTSLMRNGQVMLVYADVNSLGIRASAFDDQLVATQFDNELLNEPVEVTFEGNEGIDSVFGPDLAKRETRWRVLHPDVTVINKSIIATTTENLIGGFSDDRFEFYKGGSISGFVSGGNNVVSGHNVLSYQHFPGDVFVNLNSSTATAIAGSFSFINEFVGTGDGQSTMFGFEQGAVWDVVARDQGTVETLGNGAVSYEFTEFNNLVGGSGSDWFGFANDAYVTGTVTGIIDGPNAFDYLDFSRFTNDVLVNLQSREAGIIGGESFNVRGIEVVVTGFGNDILIGDHRNNFLFGNDGDDLILGLGGSDWIDGGSGNDVLVGGDGLDLLLGLSGDDIVIGGNTKHSGTNLVEIRTYWSRTDLSYSTKVNDLRTGILVGNQVLALNSSTVTDDGVLDLLFGNGDQDWFWANLAIDLIDRVSAEELN